VAKARSDDELVAKAFDADKHEELARAVEQLSPEQAEFFLKKLEAALRKRKIQLLGYLIAMIAYFGISDGFVGWVFLVPFALVGVILYVFGMWANNVGARVPEVGYDPKP
jgi:hypothetical protein